MKFIATLTGTITDTDEDTHPCAPKNYAKSILETLLPYNGSEIVDFDSDSIEVYLSLEADNFLHIIHNALMNYQIDIKNKHAGEFYDAAHNVRYRDLIQQTADRVRSKIATLQQ